MKSLSKKALVLLLSIAIVLSFSAFSIVVNADNEQSDYTGGQVDPNNNCDHLNLGDWQSDATNHWHICSDCSGEVDKTAHTYQWVETKAATKEENGLKEEICSVCGYKSGNSEEIVFESGHTPGDINGDGAVNNKDLTRLFQYLSDWNVTVVNDALDVNGDGSVNNKDLTRLFQYLSDWVVEIH